MLITRTCLSLIVNKCLFLKVHETKLLTNLFHLQRLARVKPILCIAALSKQSREVMLDITSQNIDHKRQHLFACILYVESLHLFLYFGEHDFNRIKKRCVGWEVNYFNPNGSQVVCDIRITMYLCTVQDPYRVTTGKVLDLRIIKRVSYLGMHCHLLHTIKVSKTIKCAHSAVNIYNSFTSHKAKEGDTLRASKLGIPQNESLPFHPPPPPPPAISVIHTNLITKHKRLFGKLDFRKLVRKTNYILQRYLYRASLQHLIMKAFAIYLSSEASIMQDHSDIRNRNGNLKNSFESLLRFV
jgi:hypothetical protein